MKRIVLVTLFILMVFCTNIFAKGDNIVLRVDGKAVNSDVSPFIKDGRTYVPARFVGEILGMEVSFKKGFLGGDEDSLFVYLKAKNGRVVEINGFGIFADGISFGAYDFTKAYIVAKNRTFVPIRFIAQALHMDVKWDNNSKSVELFTNKSPEDYKLLLGNEVDKNGELIYKPSKIYKIHFNGDKYILKPTDMTVTEFYEKKIYPKMETNFDEILKSEEYIFGINCYFLDPDKKEVKAFSCN